MEADKLVAKTFSHEKKRKNHSQMITLIICYIGEWPSWIHLFLKTCQYNPEISFIIFSERSPLISYYQNISFVPFSLDKFNKLASKKLKISVSIKNTYKLCDFRPAFGLIFEDYIINSNFWGYCDIDIIFGKISNFINLNTISQYDIITSRKEYLTGHFTIYKNEVITNNLFRNSKDYQQVFFSDTHYCFDECNYLWFKLLAGHPVDTVDSTIANMTHVVYMMEKLKVVKPLFKTLVFEQDQLDAEGNLLPWVGEISWRNGILTESITKQEYMYAHFHFIKKKPSFNVPYSKQTPNYFSLSETGFSFE